MRRLLPTARTLLCRPAVFHAGQGATLAVVAVMAMAMAPLGQGAEAPLPGSVPVAPPILAKAEPAGPLMRQMVFEVPVRGYGINSGYGQRTLGGQTRAHEGVDFAAPRGTGVFAAAEGQVLRTGFDAGGYGSFVEVRHPNGMTSLYGHLSRIDVHSGMNLTTGQRIGLVGSTGRSTGPHLHFEVRRAGKPVNPDRVIGKSFPVVVSPA